ncbi:Nonribosomal peptide synthetase dtxS1 [Lachnellula suecica]|uniref:Nonribosomal peptide synthetase dtxS1 n=1 Tax=Lachnellula suecica TaxID=602035 RepID=A0A8T9CFC9_9HELO|nr:Nonribosomal peptide synthetase dtxS1 [Lachnellula suecica]
MWKWNATVPVSANGCIHDLITQKAREQPLSTALCAWDGQLNYQQLEDLTTALAVDLVGRGVGRGCIVRLLFEKSMWQSVAALAVFKAGAAAVGIDAATESRERIGQIMQLTKAKICLFSVSNGSWASENGVENLVIGPDLPTNTSTPNNQSAQMTSSTSSFASGSTGTPKGVKITHNNLSSALLDQRDALGYHPNSRVLDFTYYAFDVSWSNLLNTLTAGNIPLSTTSYSQLTYQGATLCIPSADERQNALPEALKSYAITLADLPPSLARHTTGLSELATFILGGETVQQSDASLARAVKNAYGPAECTLSAALTDASSSSIGIGVGVCT